MIDSLLEQKEYDEIKRVTAHINTVTDGNKIKHYCSNVIVNTIIARMMEKAHSLAIEVLSHRKSVSMTMSLHWCLPIYLKTRWIV